MLRIFLREGHAAEDKKEALEIYKLLVEMADRVSQRRQAANNFYLSINTFLVAASAFFQAKSGGQRALLTVCLAGVVICVLWARAIESYRNLNRAKFEIIHRVERHLTIRPYTNEWQIIDSAGGIRRHVPFYSTERTVPYVFIVLYFSQVLLVISWWDLFRSMSNLIWTP